MLPGSLFALGITLFCGASVPITKIFLAQVQPWMLAGLLFLGGGLGLLPIYCWRWTKLSSSRLQPQDWRWLGASIVAGGITAPVLLTIGLTTTSAAVGSLLLNFEGVFTALLAWTSFREPWRWQILLGMIAITSSGIILSHTQQTTIGLSWGALTILGTCFAWAMDSNLTNKIADKDPFAIAMYKSGIAGAINVAIAIFIGQVLPPIGTVIAVLGVGFISSGVTYVCFVLALRQMGAARTGAYFALSPFAGAAISTLFLGEPITQSLIISASFMAIGAVLCLQAP